MRGINPPTRQAELTTEASGTDRGRKAGRQPHIRSKAVRLSCLAVAAWLAGAPLGHCDQKAPADTYVHRLEALALLETLNADLLASRSATRTLEAWCGAHHMAEEAKIHARRIAGATKDISAESRQRLAIGADTPVKYRRVELVCGTHILSQADNWYVPERLSAHMNELLETTDEPFGTVVRELSPRRQTVSVQMLWQPLPAGWELVAPPAEHAQEELAIPELLFEHRAILLKPDGQPFSEVVETYRRDIFDFGRDK